MQVKIKLFPGLEDLVGASLVSVDTDAATVGQLIGWLGREYGPEFLTWLYDQENQLRDGVFITINQRALGNLQGLDTPLREGDLVTILLPVAGG